MSSLPRYIYALVDPRTDEVRYVGATIDVTRRYRAHLTHQLDRDTPRAAWLNELLALGLKPELLVIEESSAGSWPERETFWILSYRAAGCDLTNISDGGVGAGVLIHRWAEQFDCCIECGETEHRHAAYGLCMPCYDRKKYREKYQTRYAWSLYHVACSECGTTERAHKGHGLCTNCFARRRKRRKKARQ